MIRILSKRLACTITAPSLSSTHAHPYATLCLPPHPSVYFKYHTCLVTATLLRAIDANDMERVNAVLAEDEEVHTLNLPHISHPQ